MKSKTRVPREQPAVNMASLSTSELKKSIGEILKGADLTSLSSKKVRKKLEEQYDADFTERKEEIDEVVMNMITGEKEESEAADSEEENNSGNKSSSQEESESEAEPEPAPKKPKPAVKNVPKKQTKKAPKNNVVIERHENSDSGVDDEALARQLQEEERTSRTRACAVKRNTRKREPRKKSKNDEDKPKVKRDTAYSKKCLLSEDLADVVGAPEMARHDVVKKMWDIVRERNLFDPKNKQFVICDDQLKKIFGTKRVRMFGMMKYLKKHVKNPSI